MSTSAAPAPVMTPRKKRGLEISAREQELRAQQSEFDRERTRIFTETGQKVSGRESQVNEQEKAVRGELRALAAERACLLTEIIAQEARLRPQQAAFDQARRAGAKKNPLTKAEQEVRAGLALLQSERAHVDGTVWRDRESAQIADAIWNTCHDPETFGSGDW